MNQLRLLFLWHTLGISYLFIITYLSLVKLPNIPSEIPMADKLIHFLIYCLITFFYKQIYTNRKISLAIFFIAYGIGIEIIQGQTQYRSFEFFDILANSIGTLMGLTIATKYFSNVLQKIEVFLKVN